MLIANIKWKPVRLHMARAKNGRFEISRGGDFRGVVTFDRKKGWHYQHRHDFGHTRSFVTAVLKVARVRSPHDPQYVQDFGLRRVVRICLSGGSWYTVVLDPPEEDRTWIFEDYPLHIENPNHHQQAQLRKVAHVVTGLLKKMQAEE